MVRLLSNKSLTSVGKSLLRAIRHRVVPLRARRVGTSGGDAPPKLPLRLEKGVACPLRVSDAPLDGSIGCGVPASGIPDSDGSDALLMAYDADKLSPRCKFSRLSWCARRTASILDVLYVYCKTENVRVFAGLLGFLYHAAHCACVLPNGKTGEVFDLQIMLTSVC